jgi:hypothetical protein
MRGSDGKEFSQCVAQFASIYGVEMTPMMFDVWWGALYEYPLEDVKIALALHVKDPDAGMFRPTPAHVLNHLARTIPEMRRKSRNSLQREYQTLRNVIEAKQLMLMNDRKLGLLEPDEYQRRMYELARDLSDLNALPKLSRFRR